MSVSPSWRTCTSLSERYTVIERHSGYTSQTSFTPCSSHCSIFACTCPALSLGETTSTTRSGIVSEKPMGTHLRVAGGSWQ